MLLIQRNKTKILYTLNNKKIGFDYSIKDGKYQLYVFFPNGFKTKLESEQFDMNSLDLLSFISILEENLLNIPFKMDLRMEYNKYVEESNNYDVETSNIIGYCIKMKQELLNYTCLGYFKPTSITKNLKVYVCDDFEIVYRDTMYDETEYFVYFNEREYTNTIDALDLSIHEVLMEVSSYLMYLNVSDDYIEKIDNELLKFI